MYNIATVTLYECDSEILIIMYMLSACVLLLGSYVTTHAYASFKTELRS